ncbi:hypothetical protein ABMA27_000702 [Loxostege sticticalis]|uniref:Spaetzle domain-containing protein n=1 Tax=Loxostege sticticalis TaxID=481309 RepID=A0ABR3I003_LOXSC
MAWIFSAIVFITLTTTLAYKFPYPRYYQPIEDQYYSSQYRRVDDSSLERDTGVPGGYQDRPQERSLTNRERNADSSQFYPQAVERSIGSGYSPQRNHQTRVDSTLENAQLRNGNSSYKILNSLPKTYPSITNRKGVDTDSAVIFPGPTSGTRKLFTPTITDNCNELGLCENSPDYPHEYVEALLAKLPDANVRFNLDIETPEIAQRGGHGQPKSNQSVELCKPDVRIIYPDKAFNKAGKPVFIINGKKNKVQGFRATQCRAPGKPCDDLVYFPPNYTASCEQKMMDRYMWALDDNGEMKQETISVPSCCMCVLQAV